MTPSEQTNNATRREWQELGFHYDVVPAKSEWLIRADRAGLIKLADILRSYSSNPRRAALSEHDHYGPYMYLKIVTWSGPDINEQDVRGTTEDIMRLGELIRRASNGAINSETVIREEYSPTAKYSIRLRIEPDGFDPASADPLLNQ